MVRVDGECANEIISSRLVYMRKTNAPSLNWNVRNKLLYFFVSVYLTWETNQTKIKWTFSFNYERCLYIRVIRKLMYASTKSSSSLKWLHSKQPNKYFPFYLLNLSWKVRGLYFFMNLTYSIETSLSLAVFISVLKQQSNTS